MNLPKLFASFQQFNPLINNTMTKTVFLILFLVTICMCLWTTQVSAVSAHSLSDNSIQSEQINVSNHPAPNKQTNSRLGQVSASNQLNGNQNRCQSGWMWFNNKCWVATHSRRDFTRAIELCKKMYNSTLPTIHSEEENEFLRQNIELQSSPIWLYARHNHQYNKTRWLDKSPVNYTRWDAGQPNDKSSLVCIETNENWYLKKAESSDGQTECVSFWEDAKWGTQVGCLVLLPVVCERKLTPMSRYIEAPNGSLASQYELVQVSGGANSIIGNHLTTELIIIVTLIINVLFYGMINQQISHKKTFNY